MTASGGAFNSASRTAATYTSADLDNAAGTFLDVIVDITARTTGTVTITINGLDPVSGKYYPLLTSAVLAAVATTVLRVGPMLTAAANLVAALPVPPTFQVVAVVGTTAVTFSVGHNLSV
jgi:hypothetical protein